jgi:hypothetical protein
VLYAPIQCTVQVEARLKDGKMNQATSQRSLQAFLCHSSEDKRLVQHLYSWLTTQRGVKPWLDDEDLFPVKKRSELTPLSTRVVLW